jgi:hypothetical protein
VNSDDTARLVNLIIATWPTGPKAYVWTNTLADLDATPANRAYLALRDTTERITVAAFLSAYRAQLHDSDNGSRRHDPDPACEHCRGTGWEPGASRWRTVNGEPYEYETVQPCRCTQPATGRQPTPALTLLEEF